MVDFRKINKQCELQMNLGIYVSLDASLGYCSCQVNERDSVEALEIIRFSDRCLKNLETREADTGACLLNYRIIHTDLLLCFFPLLSRPKFLAKVRYSPIDREPG